LSGLGRCWWALSVVRSVALARFARFGRVDGGGAPKWAFSISRSGELMATQCIGLDIGSSSIKLVQIKVSRKVRTLQNFGIEPLPPGAIVDGAIANSGAVAGAIRNLTKRIHLRGKEVAIAPSSNSVIIRRLQ